MTFWTIGRWDSKDLCPYWGMD